MDGDGIRHVAQFQANVDLERVVHAQSNVLASGPLEAFPLGGDLIIAREEERRDIYTLVVGHERRGYTRIDICDDYFDPRHSRILRVANPSSDSAARILAESGATQQRSYKRAALQREHAVTSIKHLANSG